MAKLKSWFKVHPCSLLLLLKFLSLSSAIENQTILVQDVAATSNNANSPVVLSPVSVSRFRRVKSRLAVSPTPGTVSETIATASSVIVPQKITPEALIAAASAKAEAELPPTLPDFIRKMMKRFGEAKAVEALQSLDQLPLGLVMKILLVEMDKSLAPDIVAMQRYAQSSDKTLITMIGRIVAGDKNVPKEIFAMDLKLMKFPWWMRIRERMLNNLERYIAAYSLVPVAAKSAINGANKAARRPEVPDNEGLNSELADAVAASATEASDKVGRGKPVETVPTATATGNANLESLRISLLNPIQQQQLLGLAKAAAASNAQTQNLLLQTQQLSNINPFLLG